MEDRGIVSETAKSLAQMISDETSLRQTSLLLRKAIALGIPVDSSLNRNRILLVIAQTLMALLDSKCKLGQRRREEGQMVSEKSTMETISRRCNHGSMHIAVLIYSTICPKINIWDVVDKMKTLKITIDNKKSLVESITLNNILHIDDYHNHTVNQQYQCYCQIYKTVKKVKGEKKVLNCHNCLQEFHPSCQANPLFCNGCYLKFCLTDLAEEMKDPFGENKEAKLEFLGYVPTSYPEMEGQNQEQVYFNVVKFSLPGFEQQTDRKQKYIEVRLTVVDKLFPDELVLATQGLKQKFQANAFWQLDNTEYSFFLNYNEVRFTTMLSKYCISIKVPHRILDKDENILIIKAVRKNQSIKMSSTTIFEYCFGNQREQLLMVGIVSFLKSKNKNKEQFNSQGNRLPPITVHQSCNYLQFIRENINQGPYQIVNLYNQSGSQKIKTPVRSFGCQHLECFDYEQFREQHHLQKAASTQKPRHKSKKSRQPEECIEIESDSDEIVEIAEEDHDVMRGEDNLNPPKELNSSSSQLLISSTPITKKIFKTKSQEMSRKRKMKQEKVEQGPLECPVCKRRMIVLYQDPLFKDILLNSGFYKRVKILNNGEYTFENMNKVNQAPECIDIEE